MTTCLCPFYGLEPMLASGRRLSDVFPFVASQQSFKTIQGRRSLPATPETRKGSERACLEVKKLTGGRRAMPERCAGVLLSLLLAQLTLTRPKCSVREYVCHRMSAYKLFSCHRLDMSYPTGIPNNPRILSAQDWPAHNACEIGWMVRLRRRRSREIRSKGNYRVALLMP